MDIRRLNMRGSEECVHHGADFGGRGHCSRPAERRYSEPRSFTGRIRDNLLHADKAASFHNSEQKDEQ